MGDRFLAWWRGKFPYSGNQPNWAQAVALEAWLVAEQQQKQEIERLAGKLDDANSAYHSASERAANHKEESERLRGEREWKEMETAPRDGTEVLLRVERRAGVPGKMLVGHYMLGGHCIEDHPPIDAGWYFWNGSRFDKASKPMAWMRLEEEG